MWTGDAQGGIERLFTPGCAFGLTPEALRGDINERLPLLTQDKVLVISTTLFNEHAYQAGLAGAMKRVIDEFCFTYPTVKKVEHVYLYAVNGADDATRQAYLNRAYALGWEFDH